MFSLCVGWNSEPSAPKLRPLAGHVSSLSLLISSPKPVLSPSVGAWKVNVQCCIMTFDNVLSSHCVQAATLGAVGDAEMNGPSACPHEHRFSWLMDVHTASQVPAECTGPVQGLVP